MPAPGLTGYGVCGGVLIPFMLVPVPGAHPAPAPIAGAHLVDPSGAGVAPGVVSAGLVVKAPGIGALVTPVVPVGEFTIGVVVG